MLRDASTFRLLYADHSAPRLDDPPEGQLHNPDTQVA